MEKKNSITTHLNKNKWKKTFKSLSSKSFTLLLTALLTLGIFTVNINNEAVTVKADNLDPITSGGTVPAEENYSSTINTHIKDGGYTAQYGPSYGPFSGMNVLQSTNQASATAFAAGLPLGTIFINQDKVGDTLGKIEPISKDTQILAGLVWNENSGRMGYDGTKTGATKLVPGKINELKGELFKVTFEDAAVLPDGTLADLVITYSNARIVIDQRYLSAPTNEQYLHGPMYFARGNGFHSSTDDFTNFRNVSYATAAQNRVNNYTNSKYGQGFTNSQQPYPQVGSTVDATYTVVNKNGTPAEGTFVFAIAGINLDRDPDKLSGNNASKALWYSYEQNFGGVDGREYSFFSEAVSINGGLASENIYVRPNTAMHDNPAVNITDPRGQYFYPHIKKETKVIDGVSTETIKFISNSRMAPNPSGSGETEWGGNDASYSAGFVVLADAARGFKATGTTHGGGSAQGTAMNTPAFNSMQIWYRYISGSGKHGKIEITSEGNPGGNLSVGTILPGGDNPHAEDATGNEKPNTYVIAEGKTVTYTMTPDVGYKAKKIQIRVNGQLKELKFNDKAISTMKKGDSITVDTNDASIWVNPPATTEEQADPVKGEGVLTYEGNGIYTFRFNHAKANEEIYVEWEPTTADILAYKIWADDDDKDGIRVNADNKGTLPKFQLQWSKNGRDWNPVTTQMDIGIPYNLPTPVTEMTVPAGKVGSEYKDGTYVIDNSNEPTTVSHANPFTWEYLPVYTYDRSGRADKPIQYRIVEINDPWHFEYEKAQYFEHQIFDLTSSEENSIEGWGMVTDGTNTYIRRGDEEYDKGLYYIVDPSTGISQKVPATNQPDESTLTPVSSTGYWTEDHAVPYHEIEAKNEHYTSDIYVDVVKHWNDEIMKIDPLDPAEGGSEYSRVDINIILHGEIEGDTPGTTVVVDLDPGNPDTTDLIKTITVGETDNKENVTGYEKVDGYVKYVDQNNEEYVYVFDKENVQDGYYKIVSGAVDYTSGPYTFNKGAITPVKKNGDGTYKINDDRYGAMFEWLPTHYNGKHITYTVRETKTTKTGQEYDPLDEWVLTGGQLVEVKQDNKLVGYETTMTNTPDVDVEYTPVPLTIFKVDKNTGLPLEGGEFTVYTDPSIGTQGIAPESEDLIVGKTIYNKTKLYVKQKDTRDNKDKYYEVIDGAIANVPASPQPSDSDLNPTGEKINNKDVLKFDKNYIIQKYNNEYKYFELNGTTPASSPANPQPSVADLVKNGVLNGEDGYTDGINTYVKRNDEYYLVDDEGNVDSNPAVPQPDPNVTRKAKDLKSGRVLENTVVTDAQGYATVTFLVPNDDVSQIYYYLRETKAPTGYEPDTKTYAFDIDADLKTITLEDPDHEHTKPWWLKLYELIFGATPETYPNWAPSTDNRGGTLTVEDTPIVADILVRKYWNDNNDQDGKRPGDKNNPTATTDPNLPTVTLQYTIGAHTAEGSVVYTDGENKYIHKPAPADDQYYEVIREDIVGTYDYTPVPSASRPASATISSSKTCQGLPVYEGSDGNDYLLIDYEYHLVNSLDVTGEVATTAAVNQPDITKLSLVMDGDWIDATVPAEYKDPRVSYVGGPVLTHQNDAYTWTNIPAYMNGKVVTYRIKEKGDILDKDKPIYAYDIESNYTSQTHENTFNLVDNSGSAPAGLNQTVDVTNKHETQVINIEVYKTWNDDDKFDRKSSKVHLYKVVNGIEYLVTVGSGSDTHEDVGDVPVEPLEGKPIKEWHDLPTYEGGDPVTYRLKEDTIDGYVTIYEYFYTNTAGTEIKGSTEDYPDILAEDVKRTYYKQGDIIPVGKKVGDENTKAKYVIINERSVNVKVEKTWVNGANANITYELWRTIKPESELTDSKFTKTNVDASDPNVYYVHKTIVITDSEYEALSETEKAKYDERYVNNDDPTIIITVDQWNKLENTAQSKYTMKYFNNNDPSDIISAYNYNNLTPKGRIRYTITDKYVDNTGTSVLTEEEYNALTPTERLNYSRAYKDNNSDEYINVAAYNALTEKGQENYYAQYVNNEDPTDIISVETWQNLPNPQKSEYTHKYVDDKHVIISKDTYESLTPEEKAEYDIEQTTVWSPYVGGGKEGTDTVDGWELVATHVFNAIDYVSPSATGETKTYAFDDMPIKDENGNRYLYRVLEKPELLRYRENQISNTEIINNNVNVSDGNASLEVVKEVENRNWLDNDQFYFYLEPVKGVDVTDPTAPVDIGKNEVPMPYRIDPATTDITFDYTADAVKTDLQVGAIGRAATFKDIQYKENSSLYHSIQRGDVVEFYYRVYEVYSIKEDTSGSDKVITKDVSLDEETNHSGYKNGITYAGDVSNLTSSEYGSHSAVGKDSYIQTNAYINKTDSTDIISVIEYNELSDPEKANYEATTGYVNISDSSDLITAADYNTLPAVGKSAYKSQQGYIDKNGKAINERQYDELSDADKQECTSATIYSAFIPEVNEAKVIVKNVDGIITTEIQWLKDGEYKTGAVPVYTNSYSSKGEAKAWIEKRISNRKWIDYSDGKGDAFTYKVESISGSQLNVPGSTSSDSYTSKPLMSNDNPNPQTDRQELSDTEIAFGLTGNKYDNTMLNANGEGYFIYEISETPTVTYNDSNFDINNYKVNGLEYDKSKIYARLKAKDNWNGTIGFTVEYFSDASCKENYKIKDHEVWIKDDGTQTNDGKKLVPISQYETIEAMSKEEQEAQGYRKVYVAYFTNYESIDIPVRKQWVDGPAIENVNLHLYVHKFDLDIVKEDDITDEYVQSKETDGFWQTAGYTYYAERGDFLNSDGTPKYDKGSTNTSSKTYVDIEGFNMNLPKYEHVGNKTYRLVYRLLEDDTSNAYTRKYKSVTNEIITPAQWAALDDEAKKAYREVYVGVDKDIITPEEYEDLSADEKAKYSQNYLKEIEKEGDYIYTDGETLVVVNTVVAKNVAKPAAVKQLLNRNWLDSDDFKFILTPIGKYDKDGILIYTEDIPMPESDEYVNIDDDTKVISKEDYEKLADSGKDSYVVVSSYVHKDSGLAILPSDYELLDDEGKAQYDLITTITNINTGETIDQATYDALPATGKDSYLPKDINNEAHAKKDTTEVDTEGHLERLALFDEIRFKTSDLIYHESDKHYHGDFFYEMKEDIPAGVYAVDKDTLSKVDGVTFSEDNRDDYYWKDDNSGIIYDGSVHTIHIKVKENRTEELQIQVSYDEEPQGDISTGTQFTPVYTNRYDTSLKISQEIDKYIMGRNWKAGDDPDVFDFRMTPLAGAPFRDGNRNEFPPVDTHSDDEREADLEQGYAIHSARGAHVKRLKVTDDTVDEPIQKLMMPELLFTLSDLDKVVVEEGTLKYKDGSIVPKGMAYGQFVYSFEEINDYLIKAGKDVKDLSIDGDTEYVRITIIDTGKGSLDYKTEVFEDRYCQIARFDPETGEPATNPAFVNQLKRELSITKTWVDSATSDITLRLEWSVDGNSWYYVDDATWMPAGIRNTQTIEKGAFGDGLTKTWYNLPAYANINNAHDQKGDILALNDLWIYYRIIEDSIPHVETGYSYESYKPGDTMDSLDSKGNQKYFKFDDDGAPHTGPEKDDEGEYIKDEDRIKQLYVTNWPEDIAGQAKVGIVKQYIGKDWDDEEFTFLIEPVESMIGSETEAVKEGEDRNTGNYVKEEGGRQYIITPEEYNSLPAEEKAKYQPYIIKNVMPKYNKDHTNTASANKTTKEVSVNEHAANFDPLTIKLSDLAVDTRDKIDGKVNPYFGKAVGTFFYKVYEQIPAGAVDTTEEYKVATDKNGNKIKYTTEEHLVKIVAVDDGGGNIDITVSYDDREHGEYVPVYTNYSLMETPIIGYKNWVGGELNDHHNGTVTLDSNDNITSAVDDLQLQLMRKTANEDEPTKCETDDAGRELIAVWVYEKPGTPDVITWENNDTHEIISDEQYQKLSDDEKEDYTQIITPGEPAEVIKQEGEPADAVGRGNSGPYIYTIKAKVETVDEETGATTITYEDPYLDRTDATGNSYEYIIKELNVPDDYVVSYEEDLFVTNTNNTTDDIKVTKTWDDDTDAEGIRPEEITLHLYRTAQVTVEMYELAQCHDQAVAFIDITPYDTNEDGVVTIDDGEDVFNEYKARVDQKYDELVDQLIAKKEAEADPIQVEVSAKKLVKPDGATVNKWGEVVWEDLPIYDSSGQEIKYVILEESIPGYITTYTTKINPQDSDYSSDDNKIILDGEDGAQVVDVKNSLTPAVTEVKVSKEWYDNDNVDDKRPSSGIMISLYERVWDKATKAYGSEQRATYADGQTVPSITLDGVADPGDAKIKELKPDSYNKWNAVFGGLPATKNGKTVIYYVKEATDLTSAGYEEPVYTGNQLDGYIVNNTRKQDTTIATITKKWSDNDNKLNVRPDTLTMQLWRTYVDENNVTQYKQVTKDINDYDIKVLMSEDDSTAANTWKLEKNEYSNLPKNIVVDVTTVGYEEVDKSQIVNPQAEELYELVEGKYVLSEDTQIVSDKTYYKEVSVIKKESRPYTYYWKEVIPKGYTATVNPTTDPAPDEMVAQNIKKAANNATITNTLKVGQVIVTKNWEDKNDEDGSRNATIAQYKDNLKLYAKGADETMLVDGVTPVWSSDTNKTIATYSNLPIYDGDVSIVYSIDEGIIDNYTISVVATTSSINEETGKAEISITNKHTPGTTSLEFTKVWIDENGNTIRPSTKDYKDWVSLYRKTNVGEFDDVTGTYANKLTVEDIGDNKYKVQWIDLPVSDDEMNKYTYVARETIEKGSYYEAQLGENTYRPSETQDITTGDIAGGATITNKQVYQDITVRKVWIDNIFDAATDTDIVNPLRPSSISLTLTGDDSTVEGYTKTNGAVPTTSRDPLDYTFEKMPVYKADGTTKMTYTLSEGEIPNYDTEIKLIDGVLNIINTYRISKFTGSKIWIDGGLTHDNDTEVTPNLNLYQLTKNAQGQYIALKEISLSNIHTLFAEVHVDWNGNDFIIFNLPVGDASGNTYEYYVDEDKIDGYLDPTYSVNVVNTPVVVNGETVQRNGIASGGKITNKIKNEVVEITGEKIWLDPVDDPKVVITHNNPSDVTLAVHQVLGSEDKVINSDKYKITWDNITSDSKYTITSVDDGLPRYDNDRNEYTYYVIETSTNVTGQEYDTSYSGSDPEKAYNDETITNRNKKLDDKIAVEVTKQWVGDEDIKDTTRQDVTITLYKTINGARSVVDSKVIDAQAEGEDLTIKFENLDKYDKDDTRKLIQYSIDETVNIDGYTSTISSVDKSVSGKEKYTVTNTYDNGMTHLIVSKVWEDNNNQDGKRPVSVTVQLYRKIESDTEYSIVSGKTLTLTSDINWKDAFTELPIRDDDGNAYIYTVQEDSVPDGYESSVTDDFDNKSVTVTNTHNPATTTIKAKKVWVDEGKEVYRDNVVLHLYGKYSDDVVYDAGTKTIALGSPEDTIVEWNNLPVRHYQDADLSWEIVEEALYGYTASYTFENGLFTVTNTYTGPTTSISVSKDWQDDDNVDNKRPNEITYVLKQKIGDKISEVDTQTVDASDGWKYTWNNLDVVKKVTTTTNSSDSTSEKMYKNIETEETITETEYLQLLDEGTIEESEYELVENTSDTPAETVTEEVAILYSVEEVYDNTELKQRGYLKPVVYSIEPGAFKVINVRERDMTSITVEKIWDDESDADGIRPDHIEVTLYQDEKEFASVIITESDAASDDKWTYTFNQLPENGPDGKYEYTVEEAAVEDYDPTYVYDEGRKTWVVTNKHIVSSKITVEATKEWAGDEGFEEELRKDVIFTLMQKNDYGDIEVEGQDPCTIPVDDQDYVCSWSDLDSMEDGETIVYTVKESEVDGYIDSIVTTVDSENNLVKVVVTNTYVKTDQITPVSYVDPLSPEGEMILKADKYETFDKAKEMAKDQKDPPESIPEHEHYKFVDWDVNYNENSGFILVARYVKDEKLVTYIDPLSGNPVVKDEYSDDPESVIDPDSPVHGGFTFTGWKEVVDSEGNYIRMATYKCKCSTPSPTPCPINPVSYSIPLTGIDGYGY